MVTPTKTSREVASVKLHKYQGCGACPIVKDCGDKNIPLQITFLQDQFADNWGRIVRVFRKGETVRGSGRVFNDTLYCATARNESLEYSDFIQLENIEVVRIPKIRRLDSPRDVPVHE
jgi:hypothetical protein